MEWVRDKDLYYKRKHTRDWEGEYIYIGVKGSSVIDYVMVNEDVKNRIIDFKVDVRVDSDHLPLCLKIRKQEEEEENPTEAERMWKEEIIT